MKKKWYKKNKESNLERAEFIIQKGHNTVIIKKGEQYISPSRSNKAPGKYEEQNEDISTIPTVNDLLEQPL